MEAMGFEFEGPVIEQGRPCHLPRCSRACTSDWAQTGIVEAITGGGEIMVEVGLLGSVSVRAITAAGITAPIVGSISVDPVVVALSIASGVMFALHVNSYHFWMFTTLLDLSTKGSLKVLTMATSLGAVVSLPLVLLASLVYATV